MRPNVVLLSAVACYLLTSPTLVAAQLEIAEVGIILEYNATDEDAEIVISMDADLPLERIAVISPVKRGDGSDKTVLRVTNRHVKKLGLKELLVESTEPSLAQVLSSYPEGTYVFSALTVDHLSATGTAVLSHDLLAAPVVVFPLDGGTGVPVSGLVAEWDPVPGAVAYVLELENETDETALVVDVDAATTTFAVPEGWLTAGVEYAFGVAAVADTGNLTVTEIHFTTSP